MLKQIYLFSLIFIIHGFCDDNSTPGWKSLFDGKTFEGWHQLGGKHKFEIIDQMIVGTSVPKEGNAFMTTKKKFKTNHITNPADTSQTCFSNNA